MSSRHERRKAAAASRKKLAKLNMATLDQHLNDVLRRVRAEFERTGEIDPGFECMADGESFHIPANWPDGSAKPAACAVLRDSFRRRGVNRYIFTSEAWVGRTPGFAPADDPERGELVQVIAVERNGPRRYASAWIKRSGETAMLGPWEVSADAPQGWLFELLEEGHSDRAPKEEPLVPRLSARDFPNLMGEDPTSGTEFRESFEIYDQLGDLLEDPIQNVKSDPVGTLMALESELRSIAQNNGTPKGIRGVALFLKDHPDKFPMFPTVRDSVPSIEHVRRCRVSLQRFICEKRKAGSANSALITAFINMYMHLGSQIIGALGLAERIEAWDPEHQAKLRQVGLRSSYELDDEEGHVFLAISADRYPVGVIGRRNTMGELFVSNIVICPHDDFPAAVDDMKQKGFELILEAEAEELLCRLERVKGIALRTDKSKEIWKVENWGKDKWVEQTMAELGFAKAMNVQYVPDPTNLNGVVVGYRVRCAPNGLVLVPSDCDEDIFVAVRVEARKRAAFVLGWLRGSEGKLPQFYQKNCWVIPPEALHAMEKLPGKERLRAMPQYSEPNLNDLPTNGD
jgi:hypothetical protein